MTVLQTILDVKGWLVPYIDDVHGHSVPLCFKFTLREGQAILYSKRWSHSDWKEHGALLMVSLGTCLCILQHVHTKLRCHKAKLLG